MEAIALVIILMAVIVGALGSFIATYSLQRAKIRQMKKDGLAAIRKEREDYFNRGYNVCLVTEQKENGQAIEESYRNGYRDGFRKGLDSDGFNILSESTPSAGRHRYMGDEITAIYPAFAVDGVEGIETLIEDNAEGEEPTAVHEEFATA